MRESFGFVFNTPKSLVRADEELAFGGGDGGVARLSQGISGHQLEVRPRFKHEAIAALRDCVTESIREHYAGPIHAGGAAAFQAFFPDRRAGFQIDAFRHAGIGVDIDMAFVNDSGADALFGFRMVPNAMCVGDVAAKSFPPNPPIATAMPSAYNGDV
jgi:hypothetical protein